MRSLSLTEGRPGSLSLDGAWRVTGRAPGDTSEELVFEAVVPGQVHDDLARLGYIPEPFWRDNAEACQWVEDWSWTYERRFDWFPAEPADAPCWHVLEFDGLDTFAEIYLNGVHLGSCESMFTALRFDADDCLLAGENHLRVEFASPAEAVRRRQETDPRRYRACFSSDRVHARKMQCGFGWDWLQRFVTVGVWRSVRLCRHETARLYDPCVRAVAVAGETATVAVSAGVETRNADPRLEAAVVLRDPDGKTIAEKTLPVQESAFDTTFTVPGPRLWWPAGLGEQPLYTCDMTLRTAGNVAVDGAVTRFGIRTVELDQRVDPEPRVHAPGARPEEGRHFTFVVNGVPVFCRGANWAPADPFPARVTPERYRHLLELAVESHANMLRAWAGGIYEPDAFWDACDELGLLVTQDFLLACAEYPEHDPAFQALLREEFSQAVRRLRNHPSLAAWSGDNELAMIYPRDGHDAAGRATAREISGPLCAALDPSRPFLATSPDGGRKPNDFHEGDAHFNCFMEWFDSDDLDPRLALDQLWARFVSEYAVAGAAAPHSLARFMTRADMADPAARMWEYHTGTNWGPLRTTFRRMEELTRRICGHDADPVAWAHRMACCQYELVRRSAAALRRRKFACSGVLYWMYNDCWPSSAWALVDAYGTPRSGWYAFKKAFQPVALCIEPGVDEFAIWLANDTLAPADGEATLRTLTLQGEVVAERTWPVRTPANGVRQVVRVAIDPEAPIAVVDYAGPGATDRVTHHMLDPGVLALPPARVSVEVTREGAAGFVRITSDRFARAVLLDAPLVFEDNYFDLLPGEERIIGWRSPAGVFQGPLEVMWTNAAAAGASQAALR